jgi:hypothetical protein
MVLRFLRTQQPTGPVSLRGLTGPTIQQLKMPRSIKLASPNIARIVSQFGAPTTERVTGVLNRRRLMVRPEPFTGFNSPPGRF